MDEPECRVCGWIVTPAGYMHKLERGQTFATFLPCPHCLKKQQDILARQAEDSQSE